MTSQYESIIRPTVFGLKLKFGENKKYIFISLVKYCVLPGSIENGMMKGTGPFTCVSTVNYTCNDGYWLLGAGVLRCGIDGLWDNGKPLCVDKSKKPNHETMIKMKLNETVHLIEVRIIILNVTIIYTGLDCGEPPSIPNAHRFGSATEVTYRCDVCYTGGGKATCLNKQWTHDGSCESKQTHSILLQRLDN